MCVWDEKKRGKLREVKLRELVVAYGQCCLVWYTAQVAAKWQDDFDSASSYSSTIAWVYLYLGLPTVLQLIWLLL